MADTFSAIWVSHSSISDFRHCPRRYYLANVYRDPRTRHKLALTSPSLALGSAVHETLESLSVLPLADRFKIPLLERFQSAWNKISGAKGGFPDPDTEAIYKQRGEDMLRRVVAHPGPLERLAVKIKTDLPHYWLSEADNLILCGRLDWLEYDPADDSVSVLDFKTGRKDEPEDSLQLPIYYLLAHNCQTHPVKKLSYWYLERDDAPTSATLPDLDNASSIVLKYAKEIKLARALERFKCPAWPAEASAKAAGVKGCKYCEPYEQILRGEAQFIGTDASSRDIYSLLGKNGVSAQPESQIL